MYVALHTLHTKFNPWPKQARYPPMYLVLSSMNPSKHATHYYTSFFDPLTEISALREVISCSLKPVLSMFISGLCIDSMKQRKKFCHIHLKWKSLACVHFARTMSHTTSIVRHIRVHYILEKFDPGARSTIGRETSVCLQILVIVMKLFSLGLFTQG